MPAAQVFAILGHSAADECGEVDCRQQQDVGSSVVVTGDEIAARRLFRPVVVAADYGG